MPDGRLHFVGTAYFDDLQKVKLSEDIGPHYTVTSEKDGLLITESRKNNPPPPGKKPIDPRKLSDKELDEFVMRQRVEYQRGKGIMVAVLTDMKIKDTLVLPGEVGKTKAFKKDKGNTVSREMDGNAILKNVKQTMALDNAALKKKLLEVEVPDENVADLDRILMTANLQIGSVTVPKTGQPLFDYDAEVKAAQSAYPEMRKKFSLEPNAKLPGEKGK